MKVVRIVALLLAVCLIAPSCSEPPASPSPLVPPLPSPQAGLVGSLVEQTGLLECSEMPYATSTRKIGPEGGSISAGAHTLTIPAGALDAPTAITMTLTSGRGVNAVHFEPEGLKFARPAALTMSYANCNVLGRVVPKRIAYVDDGLNILTYLLSIDNLWSKRITGRLEHFSDYVVAW
jgi:hypothetical protein